MKSKKYTLSLKVSAVKVMTSAFTDRLLMKLNRKMEDEINNRTEIEGLRKRRCIVSESDCELVMVMVILREFADEIVRTEKLEMRALNPWRWWCQNPKEEVHINLKHLFSHFSIASSNIFYLKNNSNIDNLFHQFSQHEN